MGVIKKLLMAIGMDDQGPAPETDAWPKDFWEKTETDQ